MSVNENVQRLVAWEPFSHFKERLMIDSFGLSGASFVISLCDYSQKDIAKIDFNVPIAMRYMDESSRLRTWSKNVSIEQGREVCIMENSIWTQWVADESVWMSSEMLTHYCVYTLSDCVDVLVFNEVVPSITWTQSDMPS